MSTTLTPTPPRGRPRNDLARQKVLAAARAIMDAQGVAAVTMDALAAHTGVGKPTIYRTWPNAQAVAMAALLPPAPPTAPAPEHDPRIAIRASLESLIAALASRAGRSALRLIAASDGETELTRAFRHAVMLRAREEVRTILARSISEGTAPPHLDPALAADTLVAPIFFRLLAGHLPVEPAMLDSLLAMAFTGLAPPPLPPARAEA